MRNKVIVAMVLLSFFIFTGRAMGACQAEVNLAVKSYVGNIIPGAKFSIYDQIYDAGGLIKAGKQLVGGTTDKYSGWGSVKLAVASSSANFAVRVTNPSLKQADFWYFNELKLACGQTATGSIALSGVYLRVLDAGTLTPQKNIKFNIYSQASDSTGEPVKSIEQGGLSTGNSADASFFLPSQSRSQPDNYGMYMLEIKNSSGLSFWYKSLKAVDEQVTLLDYKFSEALITVKDAASGNPLPGIKLTLFEQQIGRFGGLATGHQLLSLNTNDDGEAYIQYPAGIYVIQIKFPDGRIKNFENVTIVDQQHNDINLTLEGYGQAKCNLKSNLKPSFRDQNGVLMGNLSYTVFEQKLNDDGNPMADIKLATGAVDQFGYAKTTVAVSPAKKYAMEVCDKGVRNACYWFFDLTFACNQDLLLEKKLPLTQIILRQADKKLAAGQKFKIYLESMDVDGNPIVDKSKTVGIFTLPATGQLQLRLSPNDWHGDALTYILAIEQKNKILTASFKPDAEGLTQLEYVIKPGSLINDRPALNLTGLKGRIVLQVQSRGEAWYINPADGRRYFLGKGADADRVMRRLGIGIKKADLNRIPVAVASAQSKDSDNDGLVDSLELALGTDPLKTDTDVDGFSDYEELVGGFNPLGPGKLPIDEKFARAQAGKILLQVDGRGEAWYVFPVNDKRYYLGKPEDAMFIMRELGLGISNQNLQTIPVGQ